MTREQVDELVRAGDATAAAAAMARLFAATPTAGTAAYVVSQFERLAPALTLAPMRVAILRSFTVEPLVPMLRARAYLAGIDVTVMVGGHNVFEQELLDANSQLYAFAPDLIVLAALTRDLAPALWNGDGDAESEAALAGRRVAEWLDASRRHTAASIVVQSFEQPAYATDGILDVLSATGQRRVIATLNATIADAASALRGVYVLDYDALVSRHGRLAWVDTHKDLALRVPLRPDAFAALAAEYMRFIHPLAGRICKAIVVDLDNTLWGGVLGEDGANGIQLGVEYPGSAFLALQRELKTLTRRGILLAICSKNNADEAIAVIRDHPEMQLRPSDFAAMRINWEDKAENLRGLARDLNIGTDALAFLDDNPVERDWVRAQMPEVHVFELPADPVLYVDAIRRSPVFERLDLSAEDRARVEHYRVRHERTAAADSAVSVEGFLRSLGLRAVVSDLTPATLARAAQLTQKTNQFNVTTRRYTEEQVARFAADPGAIVRSFRVSDRYGDNGLVGLMMARLRGQQCEIDTMLLSCRVIGQQVETLMLADLAQQARDLGAIRLTGRFVPTEKNKPAADVFARHGFVNAPNADEGTAWELELTRQTVLPPDWIEVTTAP